MLQKIFSGLSLLILILTVSCKKDAKTNNDAAIQSYAQQTTIYPLSIYAQNATLSFVETFKNDKITATFQLRKAADSSWQDIDYTDKNNIPLTKLIPKTAYEARVKLSNGAQESYAASYKFTTQSFDINYDKLYSGPSYLHDAANGIFSIEGAHHTIYGKGFTNESSITVTLTAIDNLSDSLKIPTTVVNDTTLTFDIPRNIVSNSPYQRNKIYSCKVGIVPLIGYSSYINHNYSVMGDLTIVNRDIIITKFTAEPATCVLLTFDGYFATHQTASVCPAYLFGISMITSECKLVIRSGTTIVSTIKMNPTGSAVCDGNGLAAADPMALSKAMLAYHEVTSLVARMSTLTPGSYTAQVTEKSQDGTMTYSDEFPFSL